MSSKIKFSTSIFSDDLEVPADHCGSSLKAKNFVSDQYGLKLHPSNYYLRHNGLVLDDQMPLQAGQRYHACIRLLGGKGGFGSMLRAMGSQIEKTTNTESCRDLSGRRMRDVNNEKKVLEYMKNKAAMDQEKERKKLENLEKKLEKPKHFFSDPKYDEQCKKISDSVDDSIQAGLMAMKRRQEESKNASESKKLKKSIYDDLSSSSDDCSSSDEDDGEQKVYSTKSDDGAGCSNGGTTSHSEDDLKSNVSN